MKPMRIIYAYINLVSATCAITLQSVVLSGMMKNASSMAPGFWVNFLTASGAYLFVYKALVKLYEKYGWRLVLREYLIEGTWYHTLRSDTKVRRGETKIKQTFDAIEFSAQNYNDEYDALSRTMWKSTSVRIEEGDWITMTYQAHRAHPGPHEKALEKEGIMRLQILRDSAGRMRGMAGTYADCAPSQSRGVVSWARVPSRMSKAQDAPCDAAENKPQVNAE